MSAPGGLLGPRREGSDPRVAVIGLDAMDAGIVRAMMAEGRMPSLSRFLADAAWAPTENPPGLVVGGVWPTITTGMGPDHHGFYCDLQIEPGTYEARRHTPVGITVPRVWDVLGAAGLRCAVLDAPIASPTSQDGVLHLVEWGSHDRFVPLGSTPPSLAADVVREFGEYPVQPKCDDYVRRGDVVGLVDALRRGIAAKERMASAFLDRGPWDLFWLVFGESHCAGHQLWGLHDPGHPDHDAALRARLGDPLLDVYERLDGAVGRLLDRLGDATTVVVLLSHGIGAHDDGDHLLAEVLRRLDDADGGPPGRVVWRERARRRIERRARQRRRARPLSGEQRFFKVPNNELYAGIRINLRGREPRGRVASGAEYDAVVARLCDDLLALEDPDTGRPVVAAVWRSDDLYDGPARDGLPDLFVVWNRGVPVRGARSPRIGTVRSGPTATRTGDHRPTGLLAVRDRAVAPGPLGTTVPAVRIAPTIAAMFGVPVPGAQGRPLDLPVGA